MPVTDSRTTIFPSPKSSSKGPDFTFERSAWDCGAQTVAGVDEVGRGPIAGPVVAAAVILDPERIPAGLNDSKKLTEGARDRIFAELIHTASFSLASLPAADIDHFNIRQASLMAMVRAVRSLPIQADHALIDGRDIPSNLPCPAQAIIKGDGRSLSIAAASVIAKVCRDRMMKRADEHWYVYAFAAHKGYPSVAHRQALAQSGPCPLHRMSFAPLRTK